MKAEFTNYLESNNWRDVLIALNEREDNIEPQFLNEDRKRLLDKHSMNPDSFIGFNEYRLVAEMAGEARKFWAKDKVLKVFFFGGADSRTQKVFSIASEWSNYCNIGFETVSGPDSADIRVSFNENGSWSYIGTDALGVAIDKATVNFGWLKSDLPEVDYRQVVLHEFGHVLGMIHEHQSPAVVIDWNEDRVYWYFWNNFGWSKEKTYHNIMFEFEKTQIRHSALDKDSIMGYWIPPEFTNNGISFPKNYELSDMDKSFIGTIY